MRHGLRERRLPGERVALIEGGASEGAEGDGSERVAVHEVGFLDCLESLEAGRARTLEVARAPETLTQVTAHSGGRTDSGFALERETFLKAPSRLGGMAEFEVGPAEREPCEPEFGIELDRTLKEDQPFLESA